MGKKEIRADYLEKRKKFPAKKLQDESLLIAKRVLAMKEFKENPYIYAYMPLPYEADVRPIIQAALKMKKRVALPKVRNGVMNFVEYHWNDPLEEGPFHVLEPRSNQYVHWNQAFVLTPGVVFDKHGNRYGYGKGYYDSYYAIHPELLRVGIGLSCQVHFGKLKTEPTDKELDYLVTAKQVLSF